MSDHPFVAVPFGAYRVAVVGTALRHSPERLLRRPAGGLPVGLLVSFAVSVAPGGALRYDITFLERTEAVLRWAAFGPVLPALPSAPLAVAAAVERRNRSGRATYSTRSTSVAMP